MQTWRELISKLNKVPGRGADSTKMSRFRKAVIRQAVLCCSAILLVVVMIFAVTTAWYTNVAKTGDLTFQAEAWGFHGEVAIQEGPTEVAPGDSGIVALSVDNSESSDKVQLSVTVSKAGMDPEMMRRIYFYVDDKKVYTFEDGETETVSRVYVGATDANNYAYFLNAGEKLTMSDSYCSDLPLKWQWVYDMEGYYFQGTVKDNAFSIQEFLRPIEYDFDQAVFDEDGNLTAVGARSLEKILTELSSADGYPGTIDLTKAVTVTSDSKELLFYPVSVTEDGTGVWAYLCTYGEVLAGIRYDTQVAEGTLTPSATATVKITAQSFQQNSVSVSSVQELTDALADPTADVLTLSEDLQLESGLVIPEGAQATLDLNGYGLTYKGTEDQYSMFSVPDGASLTLINGSIQGNGQGSSTAGNLTSCAVQSVGGEVSLSNVRLSGFDCALSVSDYLSEGQDSLVHIQNCELVADKTAIFVQGNGSASEGKTTVIIQDSTVEGSNYAGIAGQGTNTADKQLWGTDLILMNSKVSGFYAGIYLPQQQSSTLISGSEISGWTGIAVKGGSLTIESSKVSGTGDYAPAKASGGGWTDTGDAVYVESTYNWPATVTLRGSNEITSVSGWAVQLFGVDGKGPGKVLIYDGAFSGGQGAANWNKIGMFEIYGGTFTGTVEPDITRYDN